MYSSFAIPLTKIGRYFAATPEMRSSTNAACRSTRTEGISGCSFLQTNVQKRS